jgi:hypothetical protein
MLKIRADLLNKKRFFCASFLFCPFLILPGGLVTRFPRHTRSLMKGLKNKGHLPECRDPALSAFKPLAYKEAILGL